MKKPQSYFWNIELLWEKFYGKPENLLAAEVPKEKLDFTPSEKPVFFDEHNIGHLGLKTYSSRIKDGKQVFLVDNHHRVLLYFFKLFCSKNSNPSQQPLKIVHIDAHRDDAIWKQEKNFSAEIKVLNDFFSGETEYSSETEKTLQAVEDSCRVCDYLDCGVKIGLIDSVISLTQSVEFENFTLPKTPFILNVDIDIYGEEGAMVHDELKTEIIAKSWKNSSGVCIATSPGFIENNHAQKLIEIFVT